MGIMDFLGKINSIGGQDDPNSSGDKHLDYLRREDQRRRNEIEKKILRGRLKAVQKRKFRKMVKPSMISGRYKKKKFDLKL